MLHYRVLALHRHGLGEVCASCNAGALPGGIPRPAQAQCPPGYASIPGPSGPRCLNTRTGEELQASAPTPAPTPVQQAPAPIQTVSQPVEQSFTQQAPVPVMNEIPSNMPSPEATQVSMRQPSFPAYEQQETTQATPAEVEESVQEPEELEPLPMVQPAPSTGLLTALAATGTVAVLAVAGMALLK